MSIPIKPDEYAHCPGCGAECWNNDADIQSGRVKATYPQRKCKACGMAGWRNRDGKGGWNWKAATEKFHRV